ncbi:hypothetical protein ACFLQL_00470 [Verrucomicrobiota bacterium]
MGIVKDLKGQRFGRLVVKSFIGIKQHKAYWLCICDCNNKEVILSGNVLVSKNTKSCGCLRKEQFKDLKGQRFGRLTVKKLIDSGTNWNSRWLCVCDCSNKEIIVCRSSLKNGHTRSCGCLRIEQVKSLSVKRIGQRKPSTCFNKIKATYKRSARERNMPYELSDIELYTLLKNNCYYCDKTLSNLMSFNGHHFEYNGVDRVDNTKGYIVNNCVSACITCNIAKHQMTPDEFEQWIIRVYNHRNLGNKLMEKIA